MCLTVRYGALLGARGEGGRNAVDGPARDHTTALQRRCVKRPGHVAQVDDPDSIHLDEMDVQLEASFVLRDERGWPAGPFQLESPDLVDPDVDDLGEALVTKRLVHWRVDGPRRVKHAEVRGTPTCPRGSARATDFCMFDTPSGDQGPGRHVTPRW